MLQNFHFNLNNFGILLFTGTFISATAIIIRYYQNHKKYLKHKKENHNYPKFKVVLHQYERGLQAPSFSPEALKLETFLRMVNVPYENHKGTSLYITYNEERVDDGKRCVEFIINRLGKSLDSHLSNFDKSIVRAFSRLTEESLKWPIILHRFLYEPETKMNHVPIDGIDCSNVQSLSNANGYVRFTKEEVYAIGKADIKALNDFIGKKTFLMGNDACNEDATIFAYISQIIYHDKGPLNLYITKHCPNLIRYHENIKKQYWKDWYSHILDKNGQRVYFYLS